MVIIIINSVSVPSPFALFILADSAIVLPCLIDDPLLCYAFFFFSHHYFPSLSFLAALFFLFDFDSPGTSSPFIIFSLRAILVFLFVDQI